MRVDRADALVDVIHAAGHQFGPGDGAEPGAGWGKAVDIAVWNDMFPSTFCMI